MKFSQQLFEFESGLRLVFVKTPNHYTAKIKIMFMVGAEDEDEPNGLAHLLEHSVFKGTDKLTQAEISEQFNNLSADIDASTSSEFTTYSANFPKPKLEEVMKLYSHILSSSKFDAKELEKEKQVIIEEILMHEDMPDQVCFDQLVALMYNDTGIGNDIAGKINNLSSMKRGDLIDFYNAHYHSKNMLISIVGDFEFSQIIDLVNFYFNKTFTKRRSKNAICKRWSKQSNALPATGQTKKETFQANVMMGFRCPSYMDMERFDFGLIGFILGGSMSSRLFKKIRNELALCYMISSFEVPYKNNGFMAVNFSTSTENASKCIDAVNEVMVDIIKNGVTDQEFESAKALSIDRYLMSQDYPKGNLRYLAYTNKILDSDEITCYLKNCSKNKALDIFRRYVQPEKAFISIVSADENWQK